MHEHSLRQNIISGSFRNSLSDIQNSKVTCPAAQFPQTYGTTRCTPLDIPVKRSQTKHRESDIASWVQLFLTPLIFKAAVRSFYFSRYHRAATTCFQWVWSSARFLFRSIADVAWMVRLWFDVSKCAMRLLPWGFQFMAWIVMPSNGFRRESVPTSVSLFPLY